MGLDDVQKKSFIEDISFGRVATRSIHRGITDNWAKGFARSSIHHREHEEYDSKALEYVDSELFYSISQLARRFGYGKGCIA